MITEWERKKAVSDRLRAVWDAMRTSDQTAWQGLFEYAREDCAQRLERDAAMLRGLSWDEFARLQKVEAA